MLFAAIILPLARMIHSGAIDPETITKDALKDELISLGKTHEDAFEVCVTEIEEEMRLVAHCVSEGRPRSAIVLLFTLMEGEVNALIRAHLRIRGFSPATITDALKGTDFDIKLDVLLPLFDVSVPERFRNAALQCKSIRNVVVHNKATPSRMSDIGNKPSDGEIADERSTRFFADNPPSRLRGDLESFFESGINEEPAIKWGRHLFNKYLGATSGLKGPRD